MRRDFTYRSTDSVTTIHALEWKPEGPVRAVVQIIHGMVEFVGRYDRFARFLNESGIYVTGNDHLGHGASVWCEEGHGYFGHPDGNECVIGDIRKLYYITRKKYPEVPYFMLGHSMGSFLLRQYITMYGREIDGAIVMGTGYQSHATLLAGKAIARTLAVFRGWGGRCKFMDKMAMGSYNKKFEPARTPYDWLTKDTEIVDAYAKNPWNTFTFTLNGYYQMFRGLEAAEKPENIAAIPKNLPILMVSGEDDPVGECGKGVRKVYAIYRSAGIRDIRLRLYKGDRHEILNETDHEKPDHDILLWLNRHIEEGVRRENGTDY